MKEYRRAEWGASEHNGGQLKEQEAQRRSYTIFPCLGDLTPLLSHLSLFPPVHPHCASSNQGVQPPWNVKASIPGLGHVGSRTPTGSWFSDVPAFTCEKFGIQGILPVLREAAFALWQARPRYVCDPLDPKESCTCPMLLTRSAQSWTELR